MGKNNCGSGSGMLTFALTLILLIVAFKMMYRSEGYGGPKDPSGIFVNGNELMNIHATILISKGFLPKGARGNFAYSPVEKKFIGPNWKSRMVPENEMDIFPERFKLLMNNFAAARTAGDQAAGDKAEAKLIRWGTNYMGRQHSTYAPHCPMCSG
jgi:hypothetical protein